MGKLAQSTIKYLIEASFTANGVVEKPDVIGAIFGQTEGLLGQDMDLRELQKTGRIGRIEVNIKTDKGGTTGSITIPSSLDGSETALIAAAIETIERIGPCESQIKVNVVKDIRTAKRDYVVDRAKEILEKLIEQAPESEVLTESVKESVRTSEITEYKGLECGPNVMDSDEVIVVEGRADVINLLRNGIKNAVAVGGTTIPEQLSGITRGKKVTVFLDGDRGGDLILKELMHLIKIDNIVRAPDGKEVEELTNKEIHNALRKKNKVAATSTKHKTVEKKIVSEKKIHKTLEPKIKEKALDILDKMIGTRAAYIFNEKMKMEGKLPLNRFLKESKELKDAKIVIVDGTITDDMIKVAEACSINFLISESTDKTLKSKSTIIYTRSELSI